MDAVRRSSLVVLLGVALACTPDNAAPPAEPSASAPPVASAAASVSLPPAVPVNDAAFTSWHADPLLLPGAPDVPAADLPSYEITQNLDGDAASLAGEAIIELANPTKGALTELPLLLHPNASVELGVDADGAGRIDIVSVERIDLASGSRSVTRFDATRPTLVKVDLLPAVDPGDRVRVAVRYKGKLRVLPASANDLFAQAMGSLGTLTSGSGAADYGLLAVGDGIITAASAYPMVAPFRDGAFDVAPPSRLGDLAYNGIARYRVTTTVSAGVRLVTNLVDQSPTQAPGGGEVVVSEGTHVRDFIAVAGRDLARTRVKVGETDVTSVYLASDAASGERALKAARVSLETFERRFGPYPYRELDVVEASLVGGAGGVEFSGLVLVAGMLYRPFDESKHPLFTVMKLLGGEGGGLLGGLLGPMGPGTVPAPSAKPKAPPVDPMAQVKETMEVALEFTVAHEVAHQYFAGIVGNDAHRFPSLDEPIAQFAAGLALEELRGKAAAQRAMDSNVKLNYAVYRLLGGADRAVLRDTQAFATPVEYAALVYGKAPYLYVALRDKLGDEKLDRAIEKAVTRYRFQLVTTEEWIAALEAEAGGPVSGVRTTFDRYLKQTHGDKDLGVDASGDFLFQTVLTPDVAAAMNASFKQLGMSPGDLLKMLMGGGL